MDGVFQEADFVQVFKFLAVELFTVFIS
jgi:hypothetical protein